MLSVDDYLKNKTESLTVSRSSRALSIILERPLSTVCETTRKGKNNFLMSKT